MELSHYLEDLERRLESRLAAPNGTIDEPARHLLLAKCQALTAKLETPFENFQRIVFHVSVTDFFEILFGSKNTCVHGQE